MQKLNKVLATGATVAGIACMTVTAFAASSTTFTVNNVNVTGSVSYVDTNDYNPLATDSVTATTGSSSVVDLMETTATICFAEGTNMKKEIKYSQKTNTTRCSATAYESSMGVGYRGEGIHKAKHAKKSGSRTTAIIW